MGLAGLGTVGASVIAPDRTRSATTLTPRCGRPVEVVAVSARSRGKDRGIDMTKLRWVADPVALARDPGIDVFVELIGGEGDPADAAVEAALKAGKSVVTANKALLAQPRRRAGGACREAQRRAQFRGRGRRRHSDRQDFARRTRRQFPRRASTAFSMAPAITS